MMYIDPVYVAAAIGFLAASILWWGLAFYLWKRDL